MAGQGGEREVRGTGVKSSFGQAFLFQCKGRSSCPQDLLIKTGKTGLTKNARFWRHAHNEAETIAIEGSAGFRIVGGQNSQRNDQSLTKLVQKGEVVQKTKNTGQMGISQLDRKEGKGRNNHSLTREMTMSAREERQQSNQQAWIMGEHYLTNL